MHSACFALLVYMEEPRSSAVIGKLAIKICDQVNKDLLIFWHPNNKRLPPLEYLYLRNLKKWTKHDRLQNIIIGIRTGMSDKWENFIFFIDLPGCLIDWSPQSALDLATIMSWQWACDCFVLRFRVRTCKNFWFFITENTKYTQFQANKFCQWTRHQCPNKGTKVTTTLLNDVKQQIEQSWS